MISLIVLILVTGAIGFEIYFRNRNGRCQCDGVDSEKEQLKIQHEKYRAAIVLIKDMTETYKPKSDILAAISTINDIAGVCRSTLGE
jgi:hypothetical protein